MWAIALLVDTYPRSNPFRNLSEKERLALIERDYLGASLKEFDSLIKVYKKVCMTPLQRMLNEFSVKMDQRSLMLETTDYTIDNASSIDKLLTNTKVLQDTYTSLLEMVNKEAENESVLKNDRKESMSEKGLL